MTDSVHDNIVLDNCVKDILAIIKPVEDDRSKRLSTIQELENCIHSLSSLSGAAVKPFGSFVSDLYSKSGDLDLSVQLGNGSFLPINKKKKQNVLREVRKALLVRGVAGYMQFIPHARVPVLQYVSNRFGISCDISIDNFAGRVKSKIFYWVNTLDERFGDLVLLIKEWAKAQNINDPKSGSLNSYSLCLLVLFHFQTSEPPILPPLKEIYEGNIAEDITEATFYNEQHLDELCAANIARFRLQNKGQRNESSLCRLLGTFFQKIEDPVERPDNAARAVSMKGLDRIASAFNDACRKFVSLEHIDRNELLALLCTPGVGLKLGGRAIANSYTKTPQTNNQHTRTGGRAERDQRTGGRAERDQRLQVSRFTGSRTVHKNPQANTTAHQAAVHYRNHPQATSVRQTLVAYPNHSSQNYTTVHQTAPYQNHTLPQVYSARPQTAVPYQNHNQQVYAGFQTEGPYLSHNQVYGTGFQTARPYQSHNQVYQAGFQPAGTYQNQNQQLRPPGFQTAGPYQNQQRRKGYPSNHQTIRHAATTARDDASAGQPCPLRLAADAMRQTQHKLIFFGSHWNIYIYHFMLQDFSMIEHVHSNDLLKTCIENILSTIKLVEDDRKKRLSAIQELEDTIYSVEALRGASVKPFGSFISNLYAKSGDLDVSIDLWNGSSLPISKKKKQNALRELMRALQIRGVARDMEFIPTARVPILQYMSNRFGISCDISINNYPGRIKSRIFYWINIMDKRFGDMVLLVKEWAKAQNINDPKNGTLNSYSLCLLVIFHFQTCEPATLPPLREIYDGNIAEKMAFYDENHVDDICVANIARFLRQNMVQRNQSSLPHLLASFFHKVFEHLVYNINKFERTLDNPSWMAKSYSFFVEDPFERPDNAARAVGAEELGRISTAFNYLSYRFTASAHADRDELLPLLCTPRVGSILGASRASRYTNTSPRRQLYSPVAANLYDDQHHQRARGSSGSRSSSQGYATGRQMARPDQHHKQPQAYNAERITAGRYQNLNRPQAYNTVLQTALPLKYHDPPPLHRTGSRTVGQYQNQQQRREYSPYQHVGTTRFEHTGGRWFYNEATWQR
ncbi:Protein HESO1 [Dichanthelium oligosanthes]|uniref:Protein HESO1 n=1 Tax=Dichanthelium oligosanthes TaxID=888268 RepID=A0A1E5W6Q4_9POAL|nr:Protein HESO1 [Dichanthelium oligosanthes]